MAIDFPGSPTVGTTYTYGGRSWTWNGQAWVATPSTAGGADLNSFLLMGA